MRIRREPITVDQFWNEKFGKYRYQVEKIQLLTLIGLKFEPFFFNLNLSSDEFITSLAEFTVYKVSERHGEPVRRLLCLSESCLIERDPSTYSICTLKPLSEVGLFCNFSSFVVYI